jgi:DNA-binding transcriptional MerR regulator
MAKKSSKDRKSLADLARESSLPARTIRYYIARGILPPPLVGGRDAWYGPEHSERLEKIRALQASGLTLAQIAWQLADKSGEEGLPEPSTWWNFAIADDVVVQVRSQMRPWRLKRVRSLISRMAAELKAAEAEEESHAR